MKIVDQTVITIQSLAIVTRAVTVLMVEIALFIVRTNAKVTLLIWELTVLRDGCNKFRLSI